MAEKLEVLIMALLMAGVCGIAGYLLREKKAEILKTISDLVQKAEDAVEGSGMGEEKKKLVVAQLEAMGVTVTTWVSNAIDSVVTALNEKSAWFTKKAESTTNEDTEA